MRGDISLVNWPQNDYWLGPLLGVSPDVAARHRDAEPSSSACRSSTGCRRKHRVPTAGAGWHGLAAARRSRRHERRPGEGRLHPREPAHQGRVHGHRTARRAPTPACRQPAWRAAAVDRRAIRRHRRHRQLPHRPAPEHGGDNYIDISSLPFQIPLGALIPQRVENLLAGLQEHRHDAHHQRLLPAASGRVEHRRSGRRPGSQCPPGEGAAAADPKRREAAAGLPAGATSAGIRAGLADAATSIRLTRTGRPAAPRGESVAVQLAPFNAQADIRGRRGAHRSGHAAVDGPTRRAAPAPLALLHVQ